MAYVMSDPEPKAKSKALYYGMRHAIGALSDHINRTVG